MIRFPCSHCGRGLTAKEHLAGLVLRCPGCRENVTVPATAPATMPADSLPCEQPTPPPDQRPRPSSPSVDATEAPTKPPPDGSSAETAAGVPPAPRAAEHGDLVSFLGPPQGPGELGRLGGYIVREVLGAGGMGVVFQALDPQLERLVALKAMLPTLAASPSARERFLREARAAAKVKHDHIVTIHQVGEERGVPFLAMEFLEGEALDTRLKREAKLPVAEVVRIARETAEGLQAAHERGLVHRDIKPANLWLEGPRGRVKVLDFGLARAAREEAQLTQPGAILGTPAYMAPEQASSQPVDGRCDLFSLGCVLYRMLTGQMPFKGLDTLSLLLAVATEEPPPPAQLAPELPAALSALVMRLLAKKPDDRPASAQAVVELLAGLAGDGTMAVEPSRPVKMARLAPLPAGPAPPSQADAEWFHQGAQPTAPPPPGLRPGDGPDDRPPARRTGRHLLVFAALGLCVLAGGGVAVVGLGLLPGSGKQVTRQEGDPTVPPPPPGKRLSLQALVTQPAPLKDVQGWTIETRTARGPLWAVAFHPSDGSLAASGQDGTVRIHDARTGNLRKALVGTGVPILCLAFCPDGKKLAVAGQAHEVWVWDLATGRCRPPLKGHTGWVRALAWSADGTMLASGGDDRVVRIWQPEIAGQLPPLRGHDIRVTTLSWSADSKRLASSDEGGTVRVWDPIAGKARALRGTSGTWSPKGPGLVYIDGERVRVWNAAKEKEGRTWTAHQARGYRVAWAPAGKLFVSCGHDGLMKVWGAFTGKPLRDWQGDFVNYQHLSLAWSPDGKAVAYTDRTGLHLREALSGRLVLDFHRHEMSRAASHSLAGSQLVLGHEDRTLRFWDLGAVRLQRTVMLPGQGPARGLAWSPGGKRLAIVPTRGQARLYDPATRRFELLPGSNEPSQASWSPDGELLLVRNRRGARLFRMKDIQRTTPLAGSVGAPWIFWSPDGRHLACGSDEGAGVVRLWSVPDGKYRELRGHKGAVRAVGFSPDSKWLASGGQDRTVRIWEVATGKPQPPLAGHTGAVFHVAWSPDGRALVSSSQDNTARLWDSSGKGLHTLSSEGRLGRIYWSGDGKTLAAVTADKVFLWDAETGKVRQRLAEVERRPSWLAWTSDSRALLIGRPDGAVDLWDAVAGRRRCTLFDFRNEQGLAVTPDGHHDGTPQIERELVWVVQTAEGQETLTLEQFADKYQKNDPGRVRVAVPAVGGKP